MKAVSLFSGIGGFELALRQWGIETVASCEIDKHARKVLARHFPETKLFNDVTTLTGQELFDAGFDSDGVICGGFPCQDVSVAGARRGLSDSDGNRTRSGLFWEVVRLLEETKARIFILENVPGLLSSNKGRDFGIVLDSLVELGYGVSWRIFDAQFFGVPQRRKRIFIVGCLGDDGRTSQEILAFFDRSGWDSQESEPKGKATANPITGGIGGAGEVVSTIPAEIYHHGTVVNQDVDAGHLIVGFTGSSFAQYREGVGTLRANGGDLGGGLKH